MLNSDARLALRKKLLRRLIWKAPLILGLVSFAVWWQVRQESSPPEPTSNVAAAQRIAGNWQGEITYPSGAKIVEQFFFQPEGDRLFGTASFHGVKRGIEDGQIVGDTILFKARFDEPSEGALRERLHRYEGKREGDSIRLKMFDDKGSAPVEVKLVPAK